MKEFKFNPIRRILVPTDFSANADGAIRYAAALAVRLGSKLILFHSVKVPVAALHETAVLTVDEMQLQDSSLQLERIKSELRSFHPGLNVETKTSVGFAVDEIIDWCNSKKADLIVMGTRGAHGLGEILVGSNTAEVIAKSQCPVLAVPVNAELSDVRKIVFATNYADNDFQSIFLLTEIFKPWNPEIIVVHAEEGGDRRVESDQFEWFKSQVVTSISYDKFYFNLIDGENTGQAVSDFAAENGADIITVSTRRRNLFEKLTSRSISRRLAYHTHIPLLAFHTQRAGSVPLLF